MYNLKAAAGNFMDWSAMDVSRWVELPTHRKPFKDLFACKVIGESMNQIIPNGSICLFRKYEGGSRDGKVVLVQFNNLPAEDTGQGYTVKEYRSTKKLADEKWDHESIVLRPLSSDPSFQDIMLKKDQSEGLRVLGILEMVLNSNEGRY